MKNTSDIAHGSDTLIYSNGCLYMQNLKCQTQIFQKVFE